METSKDYLREQVVSKKDAGVLLTFIASVVALALWVFGELAL
ncbi:MAG: hypothetical protein WA058_01565 [Minisyncoccia bacterium]